MVRVYGLILSVWGLLLTAAAAACAEQTVSGLHTHRVEPGMMPTSGSRARNVILMIGDGMGAEHVWAAWLCNHGKLNIERLPVTGFSRTSSASHTITDSAAGGTAIACGRKAHNGHLGQTPDGRPVISLMQLLAAGGRRTGMVVTKAITDATPAAFYAHVNDRHDTESVAAALVNSGCRVITGGGADCVTPAQVAELRARGAVVRLAAPRDCPPASQRGDFLEKAVEEALGILGQGENGFFLLVEGSCIDLAAHENNLRETVLETLDFDRAIGCVLRWMQQHPDTLLVVTADHQTGGLSILGGSAARGEVRGAFATRNHSGVAVPVYAAGAGAARFGGIQENTEIFNKILDAADVSGSSSAPSRK